MGTTILQILIFVPIIIISVIFHEIAHGKMAEVLGDPTAKNLGRLSLNPIKHLDPFGSIILPILMYAVAGIGIGYAKPVPIDPRYFKNPQKGMALTAAAGPLANFVMAGIGGLFFKLGIIAGPGKDINSFVSYLISPNTALIGRIIILFIIVNIFLGVFNLVPMPPLDGSKIIAGFLPKSSLYSFYKMERYGMLILFILLFFFNDIISFFFINIIIPLTIFFV